MCFFVFVCLIVVVAGEGWRCPSDTDCAEYGPATDDQFFRVNGSPIVCTLNGKSYASLSCYGRALDDPRLPVLTASTAVRYVQLLNCTPPATSYVAALEARNLTLTDKLTLVIPTEIEDGLTKEHFRDLPIFLTLELTGTPKLTLDEDFLVDTGLGSLKLTNVTVTGRMLEFLPTSLRVLGLEETNVTSVPPEVLNRLNKLSSLMIRQSHNLIIDLSTSSVKTLHVRAGVLGLPIGPHVETATFQELRGLSLLGDCTSLKILSISFSHGGDLWLTKCPNLRRLSVISTPVSMGQGALEGLRNLTNVVLHNCSLSELPTDLFNTNVELSTLIVARNNLKLLPYLPPSLEYLDASINQLDLKAAQSVVSNLKKLHTLILAKNNLGDACGNKRSTSDSVKLNDVSPWWRQSRLSKLDLSGTGVTRLCADWRRAHILTNINLSNNNITRLNYYDMLWTRSNKTSVDLRNNPIKSISYDYDQYMEAIMNKKTEEQLTTLHLPYSTTCDCNWFWYAFAQEHAPRHAANIKRIRCDVKSPPEVRNKDLQAVKASLLSCDIENTTCPQSCRCVYSDAARVICENAGLQTVPELVPDLFDYVVELRLRGNDIKDIEIDDLPPRLEVLDLSNNSISLLSEPVASALAYINISVSDNPLQCDCIGKPFIHYLFSNKYRVLDFDSANCSDGLLLSAVLPSDLCPPITAGTISIIVLSCVIFSVIFAVGIILAAWKWLPDRLQRKLAFIARPFNFTIAEEEKEYKFDVFVSHAHADWKIGKEVATVTEDAGMRACVHWRDWPPGGRISSQIAASVTSSRKTAILLSKSYLESPWARAELTAALADPQRVLIIRLDSTTGVPEELQLFISSHTYLDWRDSRFNEKLVQALQPHKKVKSNEKRLPVGEPLDTEKVDSPYLTGNDDVTVAMDDMLNNSGSLLIQDAM